MKKYSIIILLTLIISFNAKTQISWYNYVNTNWTEFLSSSVNQNEFTGNYSICNNKSGFSFYDINDFLPQINGWSFDNYISLPSWNAYVMALGDKYCYIEAFDNKVKNPVAWTHWKELRIINNLANGSCFGFAVSSQMAFDNVDGFRSDYPALIFSGSIYEMNISDDVKNCISSIWLRQFTKNGANLWKLWRSNKTPVETLQEIKNNLHSTDRFVLYLFRSWNDVHVINPYKITCNSNNENFEFIYVYDNNYQGDTIFIITIDKKLNKWYYSDNEVDSYDTLGYSSGIILDVKPVSNYCNRNYYSSDYDLIADYQTIYVNPYSTVSITDEDNKLFGYNIENDQLLDISDYTIPMLFAADTVCPPVGYFMPTKTFSVQLSDFKTPISNFTIISQYNIFTYKRDIEVINNFETDNLIFQDSIFSVTNNDLNIKKFLLETFLENDNFRFFKLSQISISHEDTISIQKINNDNLLLTNKGKSNTYNLDIELPNLYFRYSNITIPQNSSHEIDADWNNLSAEVVKIYVDWNLDGSINDTLFLDNQENYWYNLLCSI
jgi:hypothetical protein